jgi:hypothetical protein
MPLTPVGKLDRAALPAPRGERQLSGGFVAPEGEMEEAIAAIWQELLGINRVSVHDSFFELGGNSLLMINLRSRLAESIGREIPIVELFAHPTVRRQAKHCSGISPAANRRDGVALRAQRSREAIARRAASARRGAAGGRTAGSRRNARNHEDVDER